MTATPPTKRSFFAELKERRVYRAATYYVVAAFAVLQGADLLVPVFNVADWLYRGLAIALAAGFPVAVALAWVLDVTPDGITRASGGQVIGGRWARHGLRALVAIASVAALTVLTVAARRALVESASGDGNRIMVFPLVVSGSPELSPSVGEDVATMIGHALDGAGPLRWVDAWPLLGEGTRDNVRLLLLNDAQRLARDYDCGYFVTGRLVARGDSTEVLLELRVSSSGATVDQSQAVGPSTDPWRVGLRAVTKLLPQLIPTQVPDVAADFESRPPGSVARFLVGEAHYRRTRFREAFQQYQLAFDDDSTFALAAIRAAQSASWDHDVGAASRYIDAALRLRLDARERLFVTGVRAYLDGDAQAAIDDLAGALEIDPQMGVAWAQLGEVHRHLVPIFRDTEAADSAFARALVTDATAGNVLYHLLEDVIRVGEIQHAGDLLSRFRAIDPDPELWTQLEYMYDCVRLGPVATAPLARQWARDRPFELLLAAGQLGAKGRQLPCAQLTYHAVLVADTATDAAWMGRYESAFVGLVSTLLSGGRERDGRELLLMARDSSVYLTATLAGAAIDADGVHLQESEFERPAAAPRVDLSRAARELIMIAGAVYPEVAELAAQQAHAWFEEEGPDFSTSSWRRLALLGPWALDAGNVEYVDRIATRMASLAAEGANPTLEGLAAAAQGRSALVRGDTTEAIRRFELAEPAASRQMLTWGLLEPLGPERLTLASLLIHRDPARAARIATSFDGSAPIIHPLFLPRSLQIRAEAGPRPRQ